MARVLLYAILLMFLARALARLWRGLMEGLDGRSYTGGVPTRGAQMVRDPICGTFVLPQHAVVLSVGREEQYFCSTGCRDAYRAKQSAGSAA